jgi:hypothetical protein
MEGIMSCRLISTIVLGSLLAACGAPDSRMVALIGEPVAAAGWRQIPAEPLDACALVTKADVAAVVGQEPRSPKPAEPGRQVPGSELQGSTCQYRGDGWRIRFFVERGHDESSKKLLRTTLRGWQKVPGLGEEAYWGQSDPNKPGTMTLFDGSHAMVLSWFVRGDTPGPGTLEKSTDLLRRALDRL